MSRRRGVVALVVALVLTLVVLTNTVGRPSVWVDNRSDQVATVFVTDLGPGQAAWYQVPAHSSAHLGSAGLGSPAVRVNVLGWGNDPSISGPCDPGNYGDTLYDVPRFSAVELSIAPDGLPTVALAAEPSGLSSLSQAPLGDLPAALRCSAEPASS